MNLQDTYYNNISILESLYTSYNGYEFYKYIFPNNENKGEYDENFSKPNAVFLYRNQTKLSKKNKDNRQFNRHIMLSDTWQDDYMKFVEMNNMTLCSGLSYVGKSNKLDSSRHMNALIFDIDGVGTSELNTLLLRFGQPPKNIRTLPIPTFVVLSGTGVHLYYVFKEPVNLYPHIKIQLKHLKYELTARIWEYTQTSQEKQIQYQSINQSFRMVGSINAKYGVELVAFKTGEYIDIDYLNEYIKKSENKVNLEKIFKEPKMTLAEAKKAYPEWYEKVIINKDKTSKKWDIQSKQGYALYEWWLNQAENINGGHRYFYMMCMSVYACKCDVPFEKLESDMYDIYYKLQQVSHTNKLSEDDIHSALEMYSKEYYNLTIETISALTDVKIKRNKRNYRKQLEHMKYMNAMKSFKIEMNECTKGGRPTAKEIVSNWQTEEKNKYRKKIDCVRDTGLSKNTVYRWWID